MPAAVIPIRALQHGVWSLLEVATAGQPPQPLGILLAAEAPGTGTGTAAADLTHRLRRGADFPDLTEQEADVLAALEEDLAAKAREGGALALLAGLEEGLSHFLRISERTAIAWSGSAQAEADRLFDRYVDGRVEPYVTHLPLYSLRAAATRFGEATDSTEEGWVRAPAGLRLQDDMFVAQVVGQSMEPLIPDGSFCVFRAIAPGSRQAKRVLVEQLGETDFAARYTVKRYTSVKGVAEDGIKEEAMTEDGAWRHTRIRLEPLNPAFAAFDLAGDEFESNFRVIAEFVGVLES